MKYEKEYHACQERWISNVDYRSQQRDSLIATVSVKTDSLLSEKIDWSTNYLKNEIDGTEVLYGICIILILVWITILTFVKRNKD